MKHATVQDAYAAITKDPSAVIVDVREVAETNEVSLPNAILLPLSQFTGRIGAIKDYAHVYFICRSGGRSIQAARYAESVGLRDVYSIDGGVIAWIQAKLPHSYG